VLRIADLVRSLAGSTAPVEFVPRPRDDPQIRRPDISLARRSLGWEPAILLEEGLRRTIEWFRRRQQEEAVAATASPG
jgi:dTDP-glucose 4,6-dehydratase